jgi:hypothetical protein
MEKHTELGRKVAGYALCYGTLGLAAFFIGYLLISFALI